MKMKKVLALIVSLMLVMSLAACSGSTPASTAPESDPASAPAGSGAGVDPANYPPVDYEPASAMGVGPNGEPAAALADFSFTEEELQQLKDSNFTAAISYHQLGDQCNMVKCEAAKATLEELGIEVLAVTEAQLDDTVQVNQLETVLEMKADALLVMPHNPAVCAPVLEKAYEQGTKLVFMESIATGFTAGENCTALVSSDGYGNGWQAAIMLAEQIGYKGTVAMVYYDADYFVTNVRDQGFEECMAQNFPEITVVKSAFSDQEQCGTNGDALMAQYPDLAGVYVSWEAPAEYIMASAKAVGRDDLAIVTIDLGDTSARSIATGDMIKCSATSRSWDQGVCEAYCAAYALLGKEVPSTYVTPVALPVDSSNLLEGYCASYGMDEAPQWLADLMK